MYVECTLIYAYDSTEARGAREGPRGAACVFKSFKPDHAKQKSNIQHEEFDNEYH